MERIVTGEQMKELDAHTIKEMGMPSLVLMERAGLSVYQTMKEEGFPLDRVLILCGSGNNGADGLVVARLLALEGYDPHVCILGNREHFTEEMKRQEEIGKKYGISFVKSFQEKEYTVIVDALLGVGLSREVSGTYREAIEKINASGAKVLSVDIPSGIHSKTGAVLGAAVKADLTVTFAFKKAGLCLYPGAAHAGKILTRDVGIYPSREQSWYPDIQAWDKKELWRLRRSPEGNKGTFGKILLIAGSQNVFGAAYLSGKAAMKTGAGMLKIFTREENRASFAVFPEAMLETYGKGTDWREPLLEDMEWADVIGIGPGLGVSSQAGEILEFVLRRGKRPLVIDADGLNLLVTRLELFKDYKEEKILTPHLGEFSRLTGISPVQWRENPLELTGVWAGKLGAVLVCKDARTVIGTPEGSLYIGLEGNDGMATAGSGDVLTGIILGILAQRRTAEEAAGLGVYLHGAAGDRAAGEIGRAGMLAGDLVLETAKLLRESEREGSFYENTEKNPCGY